MPGLLEVFIRSRHPTRELTYLEKTFIHSFSHRNRNEDLHWDTIEPEKDYRADNSDVVKECFLSLCVLTGEFYL